ncbi:MAG TPA: MBL fold metallo-hydrolase [Candidatus Sumerlaeota bacterium]|nr:MBL fold metallo-hydrolase [Candidatus Sumerlaeota bacterium]
MDLSIAFHGAARSTTGSRHLLGINGCQVLLDCGMYQGPRNLTYERNLNFGFDPRAVDCVLLSHAHIDHSGNLPNLVKQDFKGPIYCTQATADLCDAMLLDSASLQERDAQWHTKKRQKAGSKEVVEPIYTVEDAEQCLKQFEGRAYLESISLCEGVEAKFHEAGHILGSASIWLDVCHNGNSRRIVFSGDIGRNGLPILRDPEVPSGVDWLLMESTYGSRLHDPIADAKEEMRQVIQRVWDRRGKIVIPSFSVERTQEVIYFLNELNTEGKLPPIRVFVDSPLAVKATEVFRRHSECFDAEMLDLLAENHDILKFPRVKYIQSLEESKGLNGDPDAAIIISASGMCEGGRVVHHLHNTIEDPRNCIMFVGYQAEGTLGRRIVERQSPVRLLGEMHDLRAEVATLNTMSGHADQNDLVAYARQVRDTSPQLRKVFLVHGEDEGLQALRERLEKELNLPVAIPDLRETCELETI